jgi:bacterial/archaeal transporter family-2 protein
MIWLLALAAVAAGCLMPLQAGINSKLRPFVGGPVPATFVSVTVSALTMAALMAATRTAVPMPGKGGPWWVWTGGVLGVAIVLAMLGLVSRLGAAFLFALIIVGQMLASLAIDHYGLLGVSQQEVTPMRLVGVALLLAGVVLIRYF